MNVCLFRVLCVVRLRSLRRADYSSRWVLTSGVFLSVIVQTRQWGGPGQYRLWCHDKKMSVWWSWGAWVTTATSVARTTAQTVNHQGRGSILESSCGVCCWQQDNGQVAFQAVPFFPRHCYSSNAPYLFTYQTRTLQLMLWLNNTLINFVCNYRRQLSACSSFLYYLKLPCFYVTELRELEGLMLRIYHNTLGRLWGTQSVNSNYCRMRYELLHSPGNSTNWQSTEHESIAVFGHNCFHNPPP